MTPITDLDVIKEINTLKNSNSQDYYGLSTIMIKKIKTIISQPIAILINKMLQEGKFPYSLKKTLIVPIYK